MYYSRCNVRGVNKAVEDIRKLSAARKTLLDNRQLNLRALQYEEQMIVSEIKKCSEVTTLQLNKSGLSMKSSVDPELHKQQLGCLSEELVGRRQAVQELGDVSKKKTSLQKKLGTSSI